MPELQERYDDAMFEFSTGNYSSAIAGFRAILEADPTHFDAQLSLGMALYRSGDLPSAIIEGHKAEKLRPNEQLVHTNLSLFYMKSGDKKSAEHYGLQARIASWKGNMSSPASNAADATDSELKVVDERPPSAKTPVRLPEMPWKKKPQQSGDDSRSSQ